MRRLFLVIGLASCAGRGVVAAGAEAWDANRVDDAIEAWSEVADRGPPSGIVLYDVGTAWLRKGNAARAIVQLRAAGARRPRDGAVNHNLALARAELGAVPPPVELAAGWMSVVTPGELAAIAWLLAALGSGLVSYARLREEGPLHRSSLAASGLGLLLVGLWVGATAVRGAADHREHPIAVVRVATTALRDGPVADASPRTQLRLGSEVRLEQSRGDFWLVVDGRDRRGWVAAAALVYPLGFEGGAH
ncbi:MAG: hypothetical protein AAF594_17675 [Bacteroidota bacterium]